MPEDISVDGASSSLSLRVDSIVAKTLDWYQSYSEWFARFLCLLAVNWIHGTTTGAACCCSMTKQSPPYVPKLFAVDAQGATKFNYAHKQTRLAKAHLSILSIHTHKVGTTSYDIGLPKDIWRGQGCLCWELGSRTKRACCIGWRFSSFLNHLRTYEVGLLGITSRNLG